MPFPTIALPGSAQHSVFPREVSGIRLWLWGSHLDKLLIPGVLSVQSTDPTLDQPEVFSAGELPSIFLIFAFYAVFCALGLPLFILEAAADKFSLSEFSQDTPAPAADPKNCFLQWKEFVLLIISLKVSLTFYHN